ncbi:MAG: 2-amino-4-hydroxy-6-hydroxymethyldihydropteridine diphosphokinase [Bacteroidales bacterium]|nr:2-amino-4-hydroxy-6-hydroxymethyldihydropteridine diphosphokinase [Bacteroidales bacterium]
MAELYLALGSNIGARKANIMSALSFLNGYLGRYEALSEIMETEAVGFDGPSFLNCVARYNTRKRPETILGICKEIERRMGRTDQPQYAADGSRIYHNRIVDIDILLYGKVQMSTPTLTIPHPQVEERPFIRPLLDQVRKND